MYVDIWWDINKHEAKLLCCWHTIRIWTLMFDGTSGCCLWRCISVYEVVVYVLRWWYYVIYYGWYNWWWVFLIWMGCRRDVVLNILCVHTYYYTWIYMLNTTFLRHRQFICMTIHLKLSSVNFDGLWCIEQWCIVGVSGIAIVCCSFQIVLAFKCEIDRIYQYRINVWSYYFIHSSATNIVVRVVWYLQNAVPKTQHLMWSCFYWELLSTCCLYRS